MNRTHLRVVQIVLAVLVGMGSLQAQHGNLILERSLYSPFESLLNDTSVKMVSAIKPHHYPDVKRNLDIDTQFFQAGFPLQKMLKEDDEPANFDLALSPAVGWVQGVELHDSASQGIGESFFGASAFARYKNKLYLNINLVTGRENPLYHLGPLADTGNVVSGRGYAHEIENGYHYKNSSGSLTYTPNDIFLFELGHGKHFWGDGYRSLLLSDLANNMSYFKISTTIWKLRYVNLFARMKDIRDGNGDYEDFRTKYASFHYLSIRLGKRLDLGLFESVIWQAQDTLIDRGFDVNYLNPIIFYRPVEFSTGSADNSIIGLNLKYMLAPKWQLYGQVVVDEFLIGDVLDREGSWRNKQGFQLGAKRFGVFGNEEIWLQSEVNYVRPYTYSHGNVIQNYGHYGQPLAHPLGANFLEWMSLAHWNHRNWYFSGQFQWAYYGSDYAERNLGGNIFRSYAFREPDFDNYTGQGVQNRLITLGANASYLIDPYSNLRLIGGAGYRMHEQGGSNFNTAYMYLGIKTALSNLYSDF